MGKNSGYGPGGIIRRSGQPKLFMAWMMPLRMKPLCPFTNSYLLAHLETPVCFSGWPGFAKFIIHTSLPLLKEWCLGGSIGGRGAVPGKHWGEKFRNSQICLPTTKVAVCFNTNSSAFLSLRTKWCHGATETYSGK